MNNPNKEIDQGFENHVEKNLSSGISFIPIMVKVWRDRFKYDVFPFLQITSTTQKLEPRKRLCGERFKNWN